jgi:hypothetical protein
VLASSGDATFSFFGVVFEDAPIAGSDYNEVTSLRDLMTREKEILW